MAALNSLSLERLRRDGQTFMEEITREYYLSTAGLKPKADLQPIYDRYEEILSAEALQMLLETFRAAPQNSEEQRQARILLEWLADSQAGRELAELEERELAWEASALVSLPDGSRMQFERTPIEMANSTDRSRRLMIEAARAALVSAELAPLRRERFQREREIIEQLGLSHGYNATWELLTGIDLGTLSSQCEQFLKDTKAMWDETFPSFVQRALRIDPKDARRSDSLALFRAREFDDAFPAVDMERRVQRQVREMGIDPVAAGRVRADTAEREGKRARAFCAPVRIPEEVYLVLRPHGGQTDWSTYLHELGHALHFAYMRPDYPFEYRWLGDNSITEAYAMLFDHRLNDQGWLARYTDLGRTKLRDFQRISGFEELHFIRRYCAKFIYETQLYGEARWDSLPDLYVELLSGATNFRYSPSEAFVDVDPRYYSARYLRAWQLQALLGETLTQLYDEDWWRNPSAGPWMVQSLFGEGQRELAHEQARRVAGRDLSFAPLVREVERLLA